MAVAGTHASKARARKEWKCARIELAFRFEVAAGGHRPTIVTIEREPDNKGFAITLLILGGAAHRGTALTCVWSMMRLASLP
jgi:hypothetical protein